MVDARRNRPSENERPAGSSSRIVPPVASCNSPHLIHTGLAGHAVARPSRVQQLWVSRQSVMAGCETPDTVVQTLVTEQEGVFRNRQIRAELSISLPPLTRRQWNHGLSITGRLARVRAPGSSGGPAALSAPGSQIRPGIAADPRGRCARASLARLACLASDALGRSDLMRQTRAALGRSAWSGLNSCLVRVLPYVKRALRVSHPTTATIVDG